MVMFRPNISLFPLLICCAVGGPVCKADDLEAVSSRVSRDYIRKQASDGSFLPESYVYAKGGYWGGPILDPTIDRMDFIDIARTVAVPLASQNYLPTSDPNTTKLLLAVYWGTTFAPEKANESEEYLLAQKRADEERQSNQTLQDALLNSGHARLGATDAEVRQAKTLNAQDGDALSASFGVMQAENQVRDQIDLRNAKMLGYDSEWARVMGGLSGPTQDMRKSSMIAELEEFRYFVVIMAYDYQLLVNSRKHKLLWETRFSIRQHTHAFDQQLMSMSMAASKYFGQDSNGLVRRSVPLGTVEVGRVKSLGFVPPPPAKAPAEPAQ